VNGADVTHDNDCWRELHNTDYKEGERESDQHQTD